MKTDLSESLYTKFIFQRYLIKHLKHFSLTMRSINLLARFRPETIIPESGIMVSAVDSSLLLVPFSRRTEQ